MAQRKSRDPQPKGEVTECAHPACDCEVLDEQYCSPACRDAGTTGRTVCGCGHAECSSAAGADAGSDAGI